MCHVTVMMRPFVEAVRRFKTEPFRSTEPLGFHTLEALIRGARPEPGSFTG